MTLWAKPRDWHWLRIALVIAAIAGAFALAFSGCATPPAPDDFAPFHTSKKITIPIAPPVTP